MENKKFSEAVAIQFSGLKVNEDQVKDVLLKADLPEKPSQWTDEQVLFFASELRKKGKPMIIAANKCDHPEAQANIKKIEEEFSDYLIYPCSADSELALREATKAGLIKYIPGERDFEIIRELSDKQNRL